MLQKSQAKLKHWVLPPKPFIKCHNNGINWTQGKNPRKYYGTSLPFESHHKPELSWKTTPILLFSPVILLPANLWTLIIKALKGGNGVMEKCGSGLLTGTSLDGRVLYCFLPRVSYFSVISTHCHVCYSCHSAKNSSSFRSSPISRQRLISAQPWKAKSPAFYIPLPVKSPLYLWASNLISVLTSALVKINSTITGMSGSS